MKKILITYASAGDGHKAAAEAIYNSLLELKKEGLKVTVVDALNYTNRIFKYLYRSGYIIMIKYVPTLWGLCYYLLDSRLFYAINRPLRRLVNWINTKKFVKLLIKENYDIVVATHFLAPEVLSNLKGKGLVSSLLVTVITDYKPHRFWQAGRTDYYVVASELTKELLKKRGIRRDRIFVAGIPIHKRFKAIIPKQEARAMLKLKPERFTILVMGGGFGVGPIEEIVLSLQRLDYDYQLVVICGHNKRLYNRLLKLKSGFTKPTTIYGFSLIVDKIMSASDIVITKVGGLSISEAMAKAVPVIFLNPIPGQEMRNADFLLRNKIGFRLRRTEDIYGLIRGFLHNKAEVARIKADMKRLARPSAAFDINCFIMGLVR